MIASEAKAEAAKQLSAKARSVGSVSQPAPTARFAKFGRDLAAMFETGLRSYRTGPSRGTKIDTPFQIARKLHVGGASIPLSLHNFAYVLPVLRYMFPLQNDWCSHSEHSAFMARQSHFGLPNLHLPSLGFDIN
jgi:hypothetical protein